MWEPATWYHEQEAVMESRDSVTRVGGFTWICPQPSNWLAMEIKMGRLQTKTGRRAKGREQRQKRQQDPLGIENNAL